MSKPRLEWKVGLFVAIGLVLLAALLIAFSKGLTFFRPTYTILLTAPNVGGLKTRADVLLSGVKVGTVSDIKLSPQGTNATISLSIYGAYQIYEDAQFVIESAGFLGDQYVAIVPTDNHGRVLHDQDNAKAEAPFNLQEVARSAGGLLQRIDETAKKLNEVIDDIRRRVLNEQTLTNLAAAVINIRTLSDRARVAVDKVNFLIESNTPALSQSGSNLVRFTEKINRFAGSLQEVVNTNAPDINTALKNLESSTATLKQVLGDLQAGKGAVGNLLTNEVIGADLTQIAGNLSITTSNLNRLGLWGILWQHKPPKTSAQTEPVWPVMPEKNSKN
jgi:phospholipid/cholesterol/gamma-HCH transport system substrate-binding protein